MTVQFLAAWNGYEQNQVATLAAAEESRLVTLGLCKFFEPPASARGAKGGLSVLLIGDSRTNRVNGIVSPASATRTGGIIVCQQNGHGLGSGMRVDANNAVDPTMNVRDAVVIRIDANNFGIFAPGPDGVVTPIASRVYVITVQSQLSDDGFWVWLNAKLGGALRLVRNAGVSSNNAADMLARFDADVLPYESDVLVLQLPVYNDAVLAGYTLKDLTDKDDGLYTRLLAKAVATKRDVWLVGPSALNTGNTTARHQVYLAIIKWLRMQARKLPGVTFADVYAKQVDSIANTPGNAIAGMLAGDGIHESARGAERMAQAIFEAVHLDVLRLNSYTSSSGDNYTADPSNTNIMPANAFWKATGGVVNAASGGGVSSGVIGQGLQSDAVLGAGGTAVFSMPARSDGRGYDAQVVLKSAASGNYALIRLASNVPIANAAPGTKLRVAFEVNLYGVEGSNLRTINALLNFQGGSNPTAAYLLSGTASAATSWLQPESATTSRLSLAPTLTPAQVAANTTAEQTFNVPGLLVSDVITAVSKPTAQAGLGIVGWRVSAADTLAITFANNTAAPITPTAAEVYRVSYERTGYTLAIVNENVVVPTDAGITGFDFNVYFVTGGAGSAVTCRVGVPSIDKI